MDYVIRKFQQDIVNKINEAELPIEVKRLVLAEIMQKMSEASDKAIAQQERSENEQDILED